MKFTGERMIPEYNIKSKMYLEHINRYRFARQFVRDKDVLDIACGSGYGTKILSDAGVKSILGVDISKETIDYCRKKYPDECFKKGSVDSIPVSDNSMDVVVSFETIEHVDEFVQIEFMREINRVLREDGVFIVSTPNSLVYSGADNEFHVKELEPDELKNLFERFEFEYDIFFQQSVDANYIFSSDEMKGTRKIGSDNIFFDNQDDKNVWESMFLIAVCSKIKKNHKSEGSVFISNIKSIRYPAEYIALKEILALKIDLVKKKLINLLDSNE